MNEENKFYPLLFSPVYKERIWGGGALESSLKRALPASRGPIGESWDVSDRDDGMSTVANGPLTGRTLRNLMTDFGQELIGAKHPDGGRFPLLVKIIDAGQRLSLQVHPDEAACAEIGDGAEPKTEMWYVIDADRDAKIIAGLKPNTTKTKFLNSVNSPQVEDCLQIFKAFPGDAYFIQSGRIHAIGAGNLLLEIQQNSDTTYRVSDWGRVDSEGNPRELHVEKAMRCIDFMDRTNPRISGASDKVAHNRKFPIINRCPFFSVDDLRLADTWRDDTGKDDSFHLLTPINGDIAVGRNNGEEVHIERGRTCLVPACYGEYMIWLKSNEPTTVVKAHL